LGEHSWAADYGGEKSRGADPDTQDRNTGSNTGSSRDDFKDDGVVIWKKNS